MLVNILKNIPYISLCNDDYECVFIELIFGEDKILLCAYKNPKMDQSKFKDLFEDLGEKIFDKKIM